MDAEPALPEVTVSEFDGVRYLHLDSIWVQGAMRVKKPLELELAYVQRMMAPLLWQPPDTWRQGPAVQLGLGAAALTKFCHQVLGRPTTAVERHPGVLAACRQFFALPPPGAGLAIELADAGEWLRSTPLCGQVRLLQVDLYDEEAAAPVLDSAAFYADCRALLAEGGVMAVNLFGRRASFVGSLGRLHEGFGADFVWPLASTKEGNTVVVAARGAELPPRAELSRRAELLHAGLGLVAKPWLRALPKR